MNSSTEKLHSVNFLPFLLEVHTHVSFCSFVRLFVCLFVCLFKLSKSRALGIPVRLAQKVPTIVDFCVQYVCNQFTKVGR